jgi:ubiquinone/menaquinone biosynthesis C-methylase UbiE
VRASGTLLGVTEAARELWDRQANDFDREPDHGLWDDEVREAWAQLLLPLVPAGSSVLDVGCGTGSLSVLMAAAGHAVCGVDLSGAMLQQARAKADHDGVRIGLVHADAARLPFASASFDVVVARHVLWAFEDPEGVLAGWVRQLRSQGTLLLVEGRWSTGAGLSPSDCLGVVLRQREDATLIPLKAPEFWGGPVQDERYLIHSRR